MLCSPHGGPGFFAMGEAFSPLDVDNMVLWISADDGALDAGGAQASNGETVDNWSDQSGNGYDFDSGSNKPTYRSGEVNGRGAVQFAENESMHTASIISAAEWDNPLTVAIVFKRGSTASGSKTLIGRGGSTNWRLHQQDSAAIRFTTNGVKTYEWFGVVGADYQLIEVVLDANHDAELWLDGVSQGTVSHTAGVNAIDGDVDLGGIGTVTDSFAYIAEILWYNKDLEASGERSSLSDWLLSRYGL